MRLTRRRFLESAAGAAVLVGCSSFEGRLAERAMGKVFRHGVASGDPRSDRVILWTRVTSPDPSRFVSVDWRVALDPDFREVVAAGSVWAGPARDWTVKIDALDLEPGTPYYYGFDALGETSPVGRTRTLPVGSLERLRLAFCSCSNGPAGFFNAYARIAERTDLDAVLHLGDYIYEYGDPGTMGRAPEPGHELVSLADYRTRHAQYKRDPDLQALHLQHPMIAVWDDHEIADNAWTGGAKNHDPATEGDWRLRRNAAVRAYYEWLPIRELPFESGWSQHGHVYRSFRFGDLAHLVMLDTRLHGREQQHPPAASPPRHLMGLRQRVWAMEELGRARVDEIAWRVLGQQVVFAPFAAPGRRPNPDAWDGYPASRDALLDWIESDRISDLIVLSGDIHSSWAMDVARDPFDPARYDPGTGRGSLAVELTAPAVSSSPLAEYAPAMEVLADARETHPHVRFVDFEARGYGLLDLDRERARAEWWFVDTVAEPSRGERLGAAFEVARGSNHLVRG
jgi:alkaline phosphatase D